jgi:hypothetical protein
MNIHRCCLVLILGGLIFGSVPLYGMSIPQMQREVNRTMSDMKNRADMDRSMQRLHSDEKLSRGPFSPAELLESPATRNKTILVKIKDTDAVDAVFKTSILEVAKHWPIIRVDELAGTIYIAPQLEVFLMMATPWERSPYHGSVVVQTTSDGVAITVSIFAKTWYRNKMDSFLSALKHGLYEKYGDVSHETRAEP